MPSEKGEEKALVGKDFRGVLPPVTHYLSSGCSLLDLAIADRLPGGFPAGRISHVYGDESTAKTILGSEVLGSAQRQKGLASLNDVEGTWDESRAQQLHDVDTQDNTKWLFVTSDSIEHLFDEYLKDLLDRCEKVEGPCCAVIDSLSALPSLVEKDSKMADATYGSSRAKQLSMAFRKYIRPITQVDLALIFIDQTRENVGIQYGDTVTTSGGRALRFYASVRVYLSYVERIMNNQKKVVGVKLGFFVKKNKVAPPFRQGTFRVLFDYGIDDIASTLEWLHNNDPALLAQVKDKSAEVRKSVPWEVANLKISARGLESLVQKVEEGNLEKALAEELVRVWRLVHIPVERKRRVRIGN